MDEAYDFRNLPVEVTRQNVAAMESLGIYWITNLRLPVDETGQPIMSARGWVYLRCLTEWVARPDMRVGHPMKDGQLREDLYDGRCVGVFVKRATCARM